MTKEIGFKHIQSLFVSVLRDCNKKALENPKDSLFMENPEYLQPCLDGKLTIDKEVSESLNAKPESSTEVLFKCSFKYNDQDHENDNIEDCTNYYNSKSEEIYNTAQNLNIVTYTMPSLTLTLPLDHQAKIKSDIIRRYEKVSGSEQDAVVYSTLDKGQEGGKSQFEQIQGMRTFIEGRVEKLTTSPGSYSFETHLNTHRTFENKPLAEPTCDDKEAKAISIYACKVEGEDFYGSYTCNQLKLESPKVDYLLFKISQFVFCSNAFTANEDLSLDYSMYLAGQNSEGACSTGDCSTN